MTETDTYASLHRACYEVNIAANSGGIFTEGEILRTRLLALIPHNPANAKPSLYGTALQQLAQQQFLFASVLDNSAKKSALELNNLALRVIAFYKRPQPARHAPAIRAWDDEALSA